MTVVFGWAGHTGAGVDELPQVGLPCCLFGLSPQRDHQSEGCQQPAGSRGRGQV